MNLYLVMIFSITYLLMGPYRSVENVTSDIKISTVLHKNNDVLERAGEQVSGAAYGRSHHHLPAHFDTHDKNSLF